MRTKRSRIMGTQENITFVHPYTNADLLSKIFFLWMVPLFKKGYNHQLSENDIYPPLKSLDSTILGNKLRLEWNHQLRTKKVPSLWKALVKMFWKEFALMGFWYLCTESFIKLVQPIALSKLLDYYETDSTMTKADAYIYSSLIIITSLAPVLCVHNYMLRQSLLGRKVKIATMVLIYEKALNLNKSAFAETTVGQMVNLISNDVTRFEAAMLFIHDLWMTPIQLIIVLILLYIYVGPTGLVGVVLMIGFIPFQIWLSKKMSEYRLGTALKTDERIRIMSEIISGIQVIKMYTWEKPFSKLVEFSRRQEIEQIKKTSIVRAIVLSCSLFLTRTSIYACLLFYILSGRSLTTQYVYVLTSFYGILQKSVTSRFPQGAMQFAETSISIKRIQKFLLLPEVQPVTQTAPLQYDSHQNRIDLLNVSAKWHHTIEDSTLKNITVNVPSGQLAVIIGPVGSGKSTLLHLILRELSPVSGKINVRGQISYASQEPWMFVGSIRHNITFGEEFDVAKYKKVVKVCSLARDFDLLPYGDETIVGERGVSLSGGQRARINLARAVYKEADIYLLDDPLSAVDTQVGRLIFEECISGYLRDKCVILVTHQLQYLTNVRKIYVLENGKIGAAGNYEEIQTSDFAKLFSKLNHSEDVADEYEIPKSNSDAQTILKEGESQRKGNPEIAEESRSHGKVNWAVYKFYLHAGGNCGKIFTILILFVFGQALYSISEYYLTFWINMDGTNQLKNETMKTTLETLWSTYMSDHVNLMVYSAIIGLVIVIIMSRSLFFYRTCMNASTNLHKIMCDRIMYAKMQFFHKNPSGRILNRFSTDINQVDEVLPLSLLDTLQSGLMVVAITVVITSINPWMLIPSVIITSIFYLLRVVYLSTSRDTKRLEGTTRSPVYSHLTATLQGLTTIRAFAAREILKKEFDCYLNRNTSAYFMVMSLGRCFGLWLDVHCVIFVALVTLSFLFFDSRALGANVGLAITQSITLTSLFQWGMRQWSELENQMTCVERIKEYADVVPESDRGANKQPKNWPEKGAIIFDNLCLSYSSEEPPVLKHLNFQVNGSEKVGIVGRTGAGKSSIIAALFRLAHIDGKVLIDNIDSRSVPLTNLRSSISIIPQEPMLFTGTLRKNLDPFDEHSDSVLWDALNEVELKGVVSDIPGGLESLVTEGGSNFSVGQRQLVCLARAIAKKNKILVLDEATANVDPHTDSLIQSAIRKKFLNCTVLTIAHRLHTIMDSDKILVMDDGRVVEEGRPFELLQNPGGFFYNMVHQTGKNGAEKLIAVAKLLEQKRNYVT